jgi:hypothetical protein
MCRGGGRSGEGDGGGVTGGGGERGGGTWEEEGFGGGGGGGGGAVSLGDPYGGGRGRQLGVAFLHGVFLPGPYSCRSKTLTARPGLVL